MTKMYLLMAMLVAMPFGVQATSYKPNPGASYTFNITLPNGNRLCWDVAGGKAKDRSRVQIFTCKQWAKGYSNNLNQRWTYNKLHQLIGYGGLCLDASDKNGHLGALLKMRRCNGSRHQKWTLDYTGADEGHQKPFLRFKSTSGHCIGVRNGKLQRKSPLALMSCNRKRYVVFNQRVSQSALAAGCASKVRKLNKRFLSDIGGVNDYDVESHCDTYNQDVFKVFKFYLKGALHHFEDRTLSQARKAVKK